jgi:hypothetical protein
MKRCPGQNEKEPFQAPERKTRPGEREKSDILREQKGR